MDSPKSLFLNLLTVRMDKNQYPNSRSSTAGTHSTVSLRGMCSGDHYTSSTSLMVHFKYIHVTFFPSMVVILIWQVIQYNLLHACLHVTPLLIKICMYHESVPYYPFTALILYRTGGDSMFYPQCITSNPIEYLYRWSCELLVMNNTPKMSAEVIAIVEFRSILLQNTHITTCRKYPIGSNALWDVSNIFSYMYPVARYYSPFAFLEAVILILIFVISR